MRGSERKRLARRYAAEAAMHRTPEEQAHHEAREKAVLDSYAEDARRAHAEDQKLAKRRRAARLKRGPRSPDKLTQIITELKAIKAILSETKEQERAGK